MTHLTRRHVIALTGAAVLAPAVLRAAPATQALTGAAFGTEWRLVLGRADDRLRAPIAAELSVIDAQMSPWRGDSVIGRINRGGAGGHAVPDQTAGVIAAALRLAGDSGGAFDPSIGPLVAQWGFGPITGRAGLEGLTAHGDHVTKARADQTIDLCGIAKGHALDRIADLLIARGHADFLLDMGGEVTAHGAHPSGRAWQVGVEHPRDGMAEVLTLNGLTVATSGDRVNGFNLGGRRVSHIIDPRSGQPTAGVAQVSVVAQDGMTADGWATALMAAGAQGPELAAARGLDALFINADGTRHATPGFARHLA
ncbi:FAD:protein FMN transferase [Paracoccus sp. (in: a-proteobacteria)]|uniref:FAD:protein FMN transferase n=1 Tax=Paracoccus sp. TaxID=267 RepID=UPI0026DECC5B|nr:FAD:protein FMN transferase [Paracoccus sp. (in: a-proteobacteria)]MDO5647084.1 FAD:protein FMN transferase [Paracoccus sp. (in: a-proteobacteria)]